MNQNENKKTSKKTITLYIVFGIILLLGVVFASVVAWSVDYFGVGLEQIIFTMTSPMKGANSGVVVADAFKTCLPVICPTLLLYGLLVFLDCKFGLSLLKRKFKRNIDLRQILRSVIAIICVAVFVCSIVYANSSYRVIDYVKIKNSETKIYEEYYVDPKTVSITGKDTKNLICIYLESMENSYSSTDSGGFQSKNLIPNLTELANNNISFSDSEKLGGFHTVSGTSWTMGAIFSLNSGVPFAFPVKYNMNIHKRFANGIETLGDVLEKKGYRQEFLCGSDAEFGGRRNFFEKHGNYKVFDYHSAKEKGYIDEDYYAFWGFEDKYLYEIAKGEITELSLSSKPFNFSMLTVDTHFPSGYVCELCQNECSNQAENVVLCADRQLAEFVSWCKNQEFYQNTVIVILGDHPRMETVLVPKGFEDEERTMYNCIINSAKESQNITASNRTFTAMDYFPTVLSAMGFNIQGDRLGLGTDLFSNKQTLSEELGFDYLLKEVTKHSDYYVKQFS